MPRTRLFNYAALFSSLCYGVLVIAWKSADGFNSWTHFITLAPGLHLTLTTRDGGANLAFFNDGRLGPYLGGTLGITSKGSQHPTQIRDTQFDAIGVYFRLIRWPSGPKIWTVTLSLWYPLALCAILPTMWIIRRRRERREVRRRGFPVYRVSVP
jgi:hypothetical protein